MEFKPATETSSDEMRCIRKEDYTKASYLSEIKNENEPPLYNNQISNATLNQVVFDELPIINDLTGSFAARICYAQNIIIYQRRIPNESRPTLVAQRDTLLMVQPLSPPSSAISVTGRSANGSTLGIVVLEPPESLPQVDSPGNTNIIYARNMWTRILPAHWINPGLTLTFNVSGQTSTLNNIIIGAPNEVIFQTIDIGMLIEPRNNYPFANSPALHLDYYQKIPVSRLIVGEYESVHFNRVVLPNGTIYTTRSATNGDWHTGDMREYIAKILISQGINFANYGINSSDATSELPGYVAFMITAHNARGVYANGVQVHGGSGGNGMLTIDDSLGNEWSHEAGHAYSLGHFPGEWQGSSHQRAVPGVINAGWGWDRHNNRFIANFFWDRGGNQTCCGGSIPPFQGNRFNTDAMASGHASSPLSYYTLHTPYVLNIIQNFVEQYAVFSKDSPTGFKIWNSQTREFINYTNYVRAPAYIISRQSQFNIIATANDPNGNYIRTQLLRMGAVDIIPSNGNWTQNVRLPAAELQLENSIVFVDNGAQLTINILVNNQIFPVMYRHTSTFVVQNGNWIQQTNNAGLPLNIIPQNDIGVADPCNILYKEGGECNWPINPCNRGQNECGWNSIDPYNADKTEYNWKDNKDHYNQNSGSKCGSERRIDSHLIHNESVDFENFECGVRTPNGSPYCTLTSSPPSLFSSNAVYRINTQAQLALLENDTNGTYISERLQSYEEVEIITSDGNWISRIAFPSAAQVPPGRIISFTNRATWSVELIVNGQQTTYATGESVRYVSENNVWRRPLDNSDPIGTRIPRHFGVPVTTLVGYYDPENSLPSTIYPALHGGYGFVYAPNTDINSNNCYLRIHILSGIVHYQLARGRINTNAMNKFHVNIRQSDRPTRAEIVVRGSVVTSLALNLPRRPLGYTVNGIRSNSVKYVIDKADIIELNTSMKKMMDYFSEYFTVSISPTKNDQLTHIELPQFAYEGQRLVIAEKVCSPLTVILGDQRQFIIPRGERATFVYSENCWEKETAKIEKCA
ncbi:M66 family metalloprotease [Rickettsiella endosymbiont of Xylota segnis]|uniref:M66 family metalloprotease n=1 Tax=Rickettsiella endosymbiont of Xylota segnis TaxID=3066238 RepID=UPI0030CFB4DB